MNDILQEKIRLLEPVPGCYLMKNISGEIIYVGKAKRLSARVPQYFTRPHEGKTQRMVGEIADFDTIITSSEREALILEMNLIHLHNPRYNIMLKDNRSYPYVQLKYDKAPFLRIARSAKDKNAKSYGPYPD
ncbi:MAG: GIY-YIG nuclease family protein, partial [Bacilli bacterium]